MKKKMDMETTHGLSDQQLADFGRDGYLVVRGMFDAQRIREVAAWTDEVVSLPEVPGRHMVYYEDSLDRPGERVLSRIENFCTVHTGFDALLRSGIVIDCVSQLFGAPALLFKEKINFKLPGSDGFKAHQDVQAGWDRYADLHITMLISIDAATSENGCLEMARGAHRHGLLGGMWEPLPENGQPGVEYKQCPTEPGDAVFFDSFAPHRSAPNRTAAARRILYITYNRADDGDHRVRYYADKRESYPPDCERDPHRDYAFRV